MSDEQDSVTECSFCGVCYFGTKHSCLPVKVDIPKGEESEYTLKDITDILRREDQ